MIVTITTILIFIIVVTIIILLLLLFFILLLSLVYLCFYLCTYLFMCVFICCLIYLLCMYLFIYSFIYLFMYLFIYLSINLCIYIYINATNDVNTCKSKYIKIMYSKTQLPPSHYPGHSDGSHPKPGCQVDPPPPATLHWVDCELFARHWHRTAATFSDGAPADGQRKVKRTDMDRHFRNISTK